jgi:serine/threonine-protein kinase
MAEDAREGQNAPDPLIGRVIAQKLELLELLGAGAMGKVYRAHHQALDKTVAIKVLHNQEGIDPQRLLRFKAEARAASRLDHPNSVQILDFGEDGNDHLLYIAMEFLEGEDLQSLCVREGPLDAERTLRIMMQVLAALGAAHDKGVVHRDMKPGNVMLLKKRGDDGQDTDLVKVCDFGLAKIVDRGEDGSSAPVTRQGAVFGTPTYMSPEQARGEVLDPRSDLYSSGVIMYRMLAGRVPFTSETAWGILMKHMIEEPPPVSSFVLADPRVEAIVQRAMTKDREQRYQSAREMRLEIRAILKDAGVEGSWDIDSPRSRLGSLGGGPPSAAPGSGPRPPSAVGTEIGAPGASNPRRVSSGKGLSTRLETMNPPASVAPGAESVPAEAFAKTHVPGSASEGPRVLQSYAVASESVAPAARSGFSPWMAAVPGVLALVLMGYLVLDKREPARPLASAPAPTGSAGAEPPASRASTGAAPAPTGAAAELAQAPTPATAPAPAPAPAPAVGAPSGPSAPTPEPRLERPPNGARRGRRPERSRAEEGAKVAAADAPAAEPTKPAEPAAPPPGAAEPVQPAAVAPKPVVEAPAPAPAPPPPPKPAEPEGPKKLAAGFRFEASLAEISVGGGLSKRQTEEALRRQLAAASACLRAGVERAGVAASGKVRVEANVDVRGRLGGVHASSGPAAAGCIEEAFSPARLPQPDTGESRLNFEIQYRTLD